MRDRPLRILFAGTPEIALFSLEALLAGKVDESQTDESRTEVNEALFTVVGVLTNPDRPAGRHRRMTPPPVKIRAEEAAIPVLQPERLDGVARTAVNHLQPDLLVSVAYGHIFGPRFMELFSEGGINLHPSLLPRHRGPSPLQAAILAGDSQTGVTVQYIAPEMDTGAIIHQEPVPLGPRTTVGELHDDLGRRGARLLLRAVKDIATGTVTATEQDHRRATYCAKISKEAGQVSWKESARELDRMVRAYTPWPGVRCRWKEESLQFTDVVPMEGQDRSKSPGTVVGVDNGLGILVQTTDGLLAIRRLKMQARRETDYRSFLNGNQDFVGTVLK